MERESVYYNAVAIEQLFVLYVEGDVVVSKPNKKRREREIVEGRRGQTSWCWSSESKYLFIGGQRLNFSFSVHSPPGTILAFLRTVRFAFRPRN